MSVPLSSDTDFFYNSLCMRTIFVLSTCITAFTVYLIVKHTPNSMLTYRWYLINFIVSYPTLHGISLAKTSIIEIPDMLLLDGRVDFPGFHSSPSASNDRRMRIGNWSIKGHLNSTWSSQFPGPSTTTWTDGSGDRVDWLELLSGNAIESLSDRNPLPTLRHLQQNGYYAKEECANTVDNSPIHLHNSINRCVSFDKKGWRWEFGACTDGNWFSIILFNILFNILFIEFPIHRWLLRESRLHVVVRRHKDIRPLFSCRFDLHFCGGNRSGDHLHSNHVWDA